MRGSALLCACFIASSHLASSALAQQAADEDIARTHFEAATAYYERGDFEEAIREFSRAYELSQRPQLLHNIHLAYRDLQDDANAATYLRRYLDEAPEISNRPLLERRLRELEATLLETDEAEDDRHGAAWGVLVSGTLVAVGGGIAGGLALRSRNTLDDDFCEATSCRDGFESERDRGERSAMAANVLLAVGATAIVVSIPLFFLGGGDEEDEPRAQISCGPTGCIGSVRGTF